MLKAIVEHKGNTLLLEFPCERMLLAEHLASIEIRTPAHEIKCVDDEDAPIQVKIYGESGFDAKLASVVSPENTLSGVNIFCKIYHNMPYANKLDIQKAVLNGEQFRTLDAEVGVNHGGSIVTDKPLEHGEQSYIDLYKTNGILFMGKEITFGQFMEGDFETKEGVKFE